MRKTILVGDPVLVNASTVKLCPAKNVTNTCLLTLWRPQPATRQGKELSTVCSVNKSNSEDRSLPQQPPLSVLMVHPGAELYGSDRVFADAVEQMVRHDWDVTAVLGSSGPLVDRLSGTGAKVVIQPTVVLRREFLTPFGLFKLLVTVLSTCVGTWGLLKKASPSVVYISTLTIPLWVILARLHRHKIVCHVHEAEPDIPRLVRKALNSPLLLCHKIVANSQFCVETVHSTFSLLFKRTTVIDNPVPGPECLPTASTNTETPTILFLGRLSPRKAPHVAVKALKELNEMGINASLRLVGSVFRGYEWYETQLHKLVIQENLGQQVQFVPFTSHVWDEFATSDVVVMPSVVSESFGNVAIEAVLAARPVIVSDTGALSEAVSRYACAQIVGPDNPMALAEAVASYVDKREDYNQAALKDSSVARSRHDVSLFGDRLDSLLVSLVS